MCTFAIWGRILLFFTHLWVHSGAVAVVDGFMAATPLFTNMVGYFLSAFPFSVFLEFLTPNLFDFSTSSSTCRLMGIQCFIWNSCLKKRCFSWWMWEFCFLPSCQDYEHFFSTVTQSCKVKGTCQIVWNLWALLKTTQNDSMMGNLLSVSWLLLTSSSVVSTCLIRKCLSMNYCNENVVSAMRPYDFLRVPPVLIE